MFQKQFRINSEIFSHNKPMKITKNRKKNPANQPGNQQANTEKPVKNSKPDTETNI